MTMNHVTTIDKARPTWRSFVELARPRQWSKSAFVFIGPVYSLQGGLPEQPGLVAAHVLLAAAAFSLVSSAGYVVNDLLDVEVDRAHPRKRSRPLASGVLSPQQGALFACLLAAAGAACVLRLPSPQRWMVGALAGAYAVNVLAYSAVLKHRVIADVMSLSLGFVLRVLAGCAAARVLPSTSLLNVSFFLAMFLSFGKRLGERRTSGSDEQAAMIRRVQQAYSDDLLRMLLVVSGVATLLFYAIYVQDRRDVGVRGLDLMWLTILPATYGLLRAIALLERGTFDDPTEMAVHDRAFLASAMAFVVLTLGLLVWEVTHS